MKKKYTPTRKRRAIKLVCVLAVILAVAAVTRAYGFLPSNAVRQAEENSGVGRTELLGKTYDKVGHRYIYLSESDSAVLYTAAGFDLLGWICQGSNVLEKTQESVQINPSYSQSDKTSTYKLMGIVRDKNVAEILPYICDAADNEINMDMQILAEKDGVRYFYASITVPRDDDEDGGYDFVARMCDGNGNELYKKSTSMLH